MQKLNFPFFQKLFKEVRGFLNKITPQTFEELAQEFLKLEPRMNTAERASGVVDIVFQKAVDEPKFCTMYSDLYDRMTKLQLQKQQQQQAAAGNQVTKSSSVAMNKDTNFRYILLSKCQSEFEKEKKLDALKKEKEDEISMAETVSSVFSFLCSKFAIHG
jgi:translation initiation factor 4G